MPGLRAARPATSEEALSYLGCHADVLSLDPHSLDEVLDSILAVGQRAGVPTARCPGGR